MHRAERMLTLCRPLVRLCGVQRPWVMHLSAAGHANATHQDATLRRVPASSHSAYICVHTHTGPDGCPSGVEPSARCTGPKGSLSGIVGMRTVARGVVAAGSGSALGCGRKKIEKLLYDLPGDSYRRRV